MATVGAHRGLVTSIEGLELARDAASYISVERLVIERALDQVSDLARRCRDGIDEAENGIELLRSELTQAILG